VKTDKKRINNDQISDFDGIFYSQNVTNNQKQQKHFSSLNPSFQQNHHAPRAPRTHRPTPTPTHNKPTTFHPKTTTATNRKWSFEFHIF